MNKQYPYDITLSFAGEDRHYASQIFNQLKQKNISVFYDENEEDELWGKNLYDHLSDLYENKARYCIMIISKNYAKKLWTNHERKSAQARAFRENVEYILPLRLDDTEIPGITKTTGYIDLRKKSIEEVISLIVKKLGKSNTSSDEEQISNENFFFPEKRDFTQEEKDNYLLSSFSYVKKYFTRALESLKKHGLTYNVFENNEQRFFCKIYKNGEEKNSCQIFLGGWGRTDSIIFRDGNSIGNSMPVNTFFTIKNNTEKIGFESMGQQWLSQKYQGIISEEDLAKCFWEELIKKVN